MKTLFILVSLQIFRIMCLTDAAAFVTGHVFSNLESMNLFSYLLKLYWRWDLYITADISSNYNV